MLRSCGALEEAETRQRQQKSNQRKQQQHDQQGQQPSDKETTAELKSIAKTQAGSRLLTG